MAENEEKPIERVLAVFAHPDDPDFAAGGTIAKLGREGVAVGYVICTDGSQGGEDPAVPDAELSRIRYEEQRAAGARLGVTDIAFLGFRDGHLSANLDLRRAITAEIRRFRPDVVMTHFPVRALGVAIGASHPDHLAVGEATMSAVYPDARNPRAYRELLAVGLQPHVVREVWVPGWPDGDKVFDITEVMDDKVAALREHRSQFQKPDTPPDAPSAWVRERAKALGEKHGYEYAEAFRRIVTG